MKTFDVQIRAYITKTVRVQAEDEDSAIEAAHIEFDCSATDETAYNEETLGVKEVAP